MLHFGDHKGYSQSQDHDGNPAVPFSREPLVKLPQTPAIGLKYVSAPFLANMGGLPRCCST